MVGRYNVRTLGVELGQQPSVGTSTDGFILTLNADHTLAFARPGDAVFQPQGACQLELLGNWSVSCVGPQSGPSAPPPTWRYENGFVILTTSDEELSFLMGAGGRMFVAGLTTNFLPGASFSDIWVGVRLPNQ